MPSDPTHPTPPSPWQQQPDHGEASDVGSGRPAGCKAPGPGGEAGP